MKPVNKKMYFRLAVIILLSILSSAYTMAAEKKVALIIGNSDYPSNIELFGNSSYLTTPKNDANEINARLQALGFKTLVLYDATNKALGDIFKQFKEMCTNADVAVFYYSGHAVNFGKDYCLIPCKTELPNIDVLNNYCFRVSTYSDMMRKKAKLSLLFFDACRNEPIQVKSEGADKGVVVPEYDNHESQDPTGIMFFYATKNGDLTTTGIGKISPFTQALSKHLFDNGEFRSVWKYSIVPEVVELTHGNQHPDQDDIYIGDFYFNKGSQFSYDNTKNIRFNTVPGNASIEINGTKFTAGMSLKFQVGQRYKYTVTAEGYEAKTGTLYVTSESAPEETVTLNKSQEATLTLDCYNAKAEAYIDGNYIGVVPQRISTTTGSHKIRLVHSKYYTLEETVNIDPGENRLSRYLTKPTRYFFLWHEYKSTQSVSYHYSPKYQIGLSYMHQIEDSRLSIGLMLGSSIGWYRGVSAVKVSAWASSTNSEVVEVANEDGSTDVYDKTTTTFNGTSDNYSAEIDPYNEAKKYDANFLFLANGGYNLCNGVMLELGVGCGYHQDRYHMPYTYLIQKTVMTNLSTGATVGEPEYNYVRQDGAHWYNQNTKYSPAIRLGSKFAIPLDSWNKWFISLGGGYTYQPLNHKCSSWDASMGIQWYF